VIKLWLTLDIRQFLSRDLFDAKKGCSEKTVCSIHSITSEENLLEIYSIRDLHYIIWNKIFLGGDVLYIWNVTLNFNRDTNFRKNVNIYTHFHQRKLTVTSVQLWLESDYALKNENWKWKMKNEKWKIENWKIEVWPIRTKGVKIFLSSLVKFQSLIFNLHSLIPALFFVFSSFKD